MPTAEDVGRILALTKSPDELDFFYDQLTSPDWIRPLREAGLLADPPKPVEQDGGIAFPGWGFSRYLGRVAPQAPDLVAQALADIERTTNPRIQHDIIEALLAMPPEHADRFVPSVARWIHHPFRLGLVRPAARLAEILVAADRRPAALELIRSLATLVPPDGWPDAQPWLPLEDYEYGEYLPRLARSAAESGLDSARLLAAELERFLAAEHAATEDHAPRDLSFIWRPAIEDHQQNEDFDRHAKLLVVIRDGYASAVDRDRGLLAATVRDLLARPWAALKRVGLYLLRRFGSEDLDLVGSVLTNAALFGDVDVHHEFYVLASAYFHLVPAGVQARYLELVDEVAAGQTADDEPDVAERRQSWWIRNRLGAVADGLPDAARARYDYLVEEFGQEPHPDFLSYHTSWTGPTSPIAEVDLSGLDEEELVDYLARWQPDEGDERRPSPEGLGRVITVAVQQRPEAYAASAPRYIDLEPAYARGLLFGFRQALRDGKSFDWKPVLELCAALVRRPTAADEVSTADGRDSGWAWGRTAVAHLLEIGLEERSVAIPIGERERVWSIIATLAEDPDPTPESEAQYGPPNFDPLTYSINTTRGVAIHAVCGYATWVWRDAGRSADWRLSIEAPEVVRVLDAHLDMANDPSIAIRAVYGCWLAWLIALDSLWVDRHVARLLGNLSTPHELAAWETYLIHSGGDTPSYAVLADYYQRYAVRLAALDEAPSDRIAGEGPVVRFVDHLVRLRDRVPAEHRPLDVMLASGGPWLVRSIVESSGRIVHSAPAIRDEDAVSLGILWRRIKDPIARRDDPVVRQALAPFGWWFASALPASWTLPEVVAILEAGGGIDPQFLVLERLGKVADVFPSLALQALELIVAREEQGWALRTHEDDIRPVLEAAMRCADEMLRARAEALTHRLGRLGLQGLASLL